MEIPLNRNRKDLIDISVMHVDLPIAKQISKNQIQTEFGNIGLCALNVRRRFKVSFNLMEVFNICIVGIHGIYKMERGFDNAEHVAPFFVLSWYAYPILPYL